MIHFILNPNAGTNSLNKRARILSILQAIPNAKVWQTERVNHAKELTQKAISEKATKIITIGGDGTINEVKIFNGVITNPDNTDSLYSHLMFNEISRFKTLDSSGNGNHGVYYEDPVYRNEKINEYTKIGPKQKIA